MTNHSIHLACWPAVAVAATTTAVRLYAYAYALVILSTAIQLSEYN